MCGIAALFGKTLELETLYAFGNMVEIIRHRGPDDEGKEVFNFNTHFACLGHRRLSILDPSPAGHQPMCTEDRRYWMTYNGEVYNYIELREALKGLGYSFKTQTDTEVILKAYAEWGKECLNRLNGMFAFIIFDEKEKTFFVARDRFGVKPLYYWRSPSGFLAFASEIKQFTALPGWRPVLEGQCVYDFLNWGIKNHTANTFFQDVKQLRGGHYIFHPLHEVEKPVQPKSWYPRKIELFRGSLQEAAEIFHILLEDAVRLRLRADVNVGSCLSGGLDSSAIVCLAHRMLNNEDAKSKLYVFTAGSEEKKWDEQHYADLVSCHLGIKTYKTTPLLEDLFELLPHLVWHQDEPFISTSQYAQWGVFELVKRQQVKVVLNGQGSDEQLAGYHGFFGNAFYNLFSKGQWIKLLKEMRHAKRMHASLQPLPLLLNKVFPDFIRQYARKFSGKTNRHNGWFDFSKLGAANRDPFWDEPHRTVLQQSLQQIYRSSLPMLLHYEDRNSMAHSVESRTPFLDYRLVEFTLGLPTEYKIAQGWTKKVLRESMKGILPEAIRWRTDKMGFVTAEEHWVRNKSPEKFRRAVKEALEAAQGIITPSALKAANAIIDGRKPFDFLIWRMISFSEWLKRFSVQLG